MTWFIPTPRDGAVTNWWERSPNINNSNNFNNCNTSGNPNNNNNANNANGVCLGFCDDPYPGSGLTE